jgi:PST family polysaccharide transporter
MRPLIRYGWQLSLSQLVVYVSRNIDYVVLGYRYGPTATGYYNRAFDLTVNPLTQITAPSTKVSVPILSRLQSDRERFDRFLLTGQLIMLFCASPVIFLAACLAPLLVQVLLGPQWAPSGPLIQVLAIGAIARLASYPTYWLALARGATRVSLQVNLAAAPILVALVLAGSFAGSIGVAWGFSIASIIIWGMSLLWYSRVAEAPGWRMFVLAIRSVSASAAPAVVLSLLLPAMTSLDPLLQIVVGTAVFLVCWFASVALVPFLRRDASATIVAMTAYSRHR